MTNGGGKRFTQTRERTRSRLQNEERLVEAAASGDARSFAALYEQYQPYVAKIITDDVRDTSAWSDLEQAVFERAWTKLADLRNPEAFRPWLAQITRRLIVDHHRSEARTISTDFTDAEFDVEDDDWTAHDWAAVRELADTLRVAIDGLTARDATVIELATTFGFSAAEIAAALDIDSGHARVLLHRARGRLAKAVLSVRTDAA